MNAKRLIVFSLLVGLCSGPVIAKEESAYSPNEVRQAMVDALVSIEQAAGLLPEASLAISELDDEIVEMLFSSMPNQGEFMAASQEIVSRVANARARLGAGQRIVKRPLRSVKSLTGTPPFLPDYPGGINYETILLLGLVDSPDDRCGGPGYEAFEAALAGAEAAVAIGDAACEVAGCDPIVVFCLSTCGAVETVKLGVLTARVPIDACAAHGGGVDSAEIEADYENGVGILGDLAAQSGAIDNLAIALAAHDASIKSDLAAHDANIDGDLATHDADIKALLANIVANQEEIIKLLKTPQGRRPGWGVEGY